MNLLTTLFGPGFSDIVGAIGNGVLIIVVGTLVVAVIIDRVSYFVRTLFLNGSKG